jgi:hypothetical protein
LANQWWCLCGLPQRSCPDLVWEQSSRSLYSKIKGQNPTHCYFPDRGLGSGLCTLGRLVPLLRGEGHQR